VSPSQDSREAVRGVEETLAVVIATTSQTDRAAAVGLTGHAQISRREQKVHDGALEMFLDAYSGRCLVKLALWDPRLREALAAALSDRVELADERRVESDLSQFARDASAELARVLQDLSAGELTSRQAAEHDEALNLLQAEICRTRQDLGKRIRAQGRRQ